jgi:hypothetical protein
MGNPVRLRALLGDYPVTRALTVASGVAAPEPRDPAVGKLGPADRASSSSITRTRPSPPSCSSDRRRGGRGAGFSAS